MKQRIEDYRAGYSCGYFDGQASRPMNDKRCAELFFGLRQHSDAPDPVPASSREAADLNLPSNERAEYPNKALGQAAEPLGTRHPSTAIPAERGEARPPEKRLQVLIGRIDDWEGIEDDCTSHTELLLDIKQCLESVVEALAAPAAQPETTETAWQKRAEVAEADLASLKAERAWQPVETYDGHNYVLLMSPAHGRVIGGHIGGDTWHLIGVGAVTSESERPTHWMPLPAAPDRKETAPIDSERVAAPAAGEAPSANFNESRSPDGDGHEKGTVVDRATREPERPTADAVNEGTELEGAQGKPATGEPHLSATSYVSSSVVEALDAVAGSEPADSHHPASPGRRAPAQEPEPMKDHTNPVNQNAYAAVVFSEQLQKANAELSTLRASLITLRDTWKVRANHWPSPDFRSAADELDALIRDTPPEHRNAPREPIP